MQARNILTNFRSNPVRLATLGNYDQTWRERWKSGTLHSGSSKASDKPVPYIWKTRCNYWPISCCVIGRFLYP